MRSLVSSLLAMVLVLTLVTIALARGAPDKKAFTDQAVVSVSVTPIVASVAPMTVGFDLIRNESTAVIRAGTAQLITPKAAGLSTTGDEFNFTVPQPSVVLLA